MYGISGAYPVGEILMNNDDFFAAKRSWSRVKDAILASYLPPYFAKLGSDPKRRFLIIDAFAGPGIFADGTAGSPVLISIAAEKFIPGRYEVIFINNDQQAHQELADRIKGFQGASAVFGSSQEVLTRLQPRLKEPLTIFLYLDPFGVKSIPFDLLQPFLQRNPDYSTEILVNLSVPILHRTATQPEYETLLTNVFGGEYWRTALLEANDLLDAKSREKILIDGYRDQLSSTGYLNYTGACPIRETRSSQTKYYMIFASRHRDSMFLFNDLMIGSFESHMTKQEFDGTLFADIAWQDWRSTPGLEEIVTNLVAQYPSRSRKVIWEYVLRDHFLRYLEKEYRETVKRLVEQHVLSFESATGRLNDDAKLNIKQRSLF
jgi:three-Cys-motif partner protein